MKLAEVDAVKLCNEHMTATITLRRVNELRFRCWLAKQMILLAAWIMPGIWTVNEKEE